MAGHWLLGVLMTSVVTYAVATGCSPYRSLNTAGCTATHQQSSEYKLLNSVLHDGESTDTPALDFLWNATLEMHLFLHPNCAKRAESAVYLFYDMYPPDPVDQAWLSQMQEVMRQASPFTHRRRRRSSNFHYSNEESVMVTLLTNLVQATGTSCVQNLINNYKDRAATSFKSRVAGFLVPQGSSPVSSSTTKHTTIKHTPTHTTKHTTIKHTPTHTTKHTTIKHTPIHTTKHTTIKHTPIHTTKQTTIKHTPIHTTKHTTKHTTTTTPKPTTTTTATTTTTTTTTTLPRTTAKPLMCSKCSEIDCLLLDNTVQACPQPGQLCFIEINDSPSRHITRGCMDKHECRQIHNHNCEHVETDTKGNELHCKFCCDADGCNLPPRLIPQAGTVFPH